MNYRAMVRSIMLAVLFGSILAGCGTGVVLTDTRQYGSLVSELKISPPEAFDLAAKVRASGIGDGAVSKEPLCVVGRKYVFGKEHKDRIDVTGYYVDGDTGAVEFIDAPGRLYPQ